MPVITIEDISHVRYDAPDLDLMERFLLDFGLLRAARTADTLCMRGRGGGACAHITQRAPQARSRGIGLRAASADDLRRLAAHLQTRVEANDAADGGQVVRFTDPSGFEVEVLHGAANAASPPLRPPHVPNAAGVERRRGDLVRTPGGPSHAVRLGHAVLLVPSFAPMFEFYHHVLGFEIADSYHMEDPQATTFAFLRCGLGARYTDHHTLAIGTPPGGIAAPRFDHVAFEVLDLDDLQMGHMHLKAQGWRHSWGLGRHVQGSQLFDYWRDPFGHKIEHWTDGDRINDAHVRTHVPLSVEGLAQWAPPLTPEFFE
jgi:catechol 2,3-dioxygenase-like lactoylglutathione lyase family enzyme